MEETPPTQMRFRAYVMPGHNYVVESSTDLEHWTPAQTFTNADSTFDFAADLTSNAPQQFFQVVLE